MIIGQHSSGFLSYAMVMDTRHDYRDVVLRLAYLSLQILDLGMTLLAAHLGFPELNPIIKASLNSPYQLLIFKLGIPLLIILFVPGKFLIPAIVLLSAVVGWNMKELLLLWF